jgi:flagellar basal body-associated protein FliL
MSGYEPLLPPVSRPHAPPPVTVPYQPISRLPEAAPQAPGPVPSMAMPSTQEAAAATGPAGPAEPKPGSRAAKKQAKAEASRREKADAARHAEADGGRHAAGDERPRRSRKVAIVIAILLALALIAAAVAYAVLSRNPDVTNPAAKPVDPLLTTTEVAAIGDGPWQEAGVTRTPLCVGQDTEPAAQRSASRMLTAASASVLQLVYTFADDAQASQAYSAQVTEAGTCTNDTALIGGASKISGLADSADAVRLTIQGTKDEHHVLLLTRSGRSLNVFDVVGDSALTVATVAETASAALTRQCSAGGTCPSTVNVSDSLPAAGDPAGWLVAADLPQITSGSGKWTALPIQAITLSGSQCEDTDLTKVTGTTASAERVFVLTGDSKAPTQFGIDHAVWTYGSAKAASTFANKLSTSVADCSTNTPTASVNAGPSVKGVGDGGDKVSGKTWEITHKLPNDTIIFRVAVVTVGTRVSYLLANPRKDFDFTDAEWSAIALRAGQRASQAG